jgi:hypothetical protein
MESEWDRFASAHGTIYHMSAFRRLLLDSFDYSCLYHAVVDEQSRIHALVPLVAGRNLGLRRIGVALPFVNYADLISDSEGAFRFAVEAVKQLKDKHKLHYVELRLKEQDVADGGWSETLHHYTFVLPLLEDEEKVLALSSSSNRNHVRKVYKNDWFDVSFDRSNLNAFYKVYVRRMKQLGSPAPDIRFYERFLDRLSGYATLLTVLDKQTGDVVGGMLLVGSPSNSTLYYPIGANLTEYNNKYINNFMYWEAVRYGIRSGFRHLDLGRSQSGSSHYKAKEKWGAKPEQLKYLVYDGRGTKAAAPDKDSMSLAIKLWKAAPAFITDNAGKLIMKYVIMP